MRPFLCVALAGASLVFPVFAAAQTVATTASSQATASATVPHVIRVTGVFAPANGRAASPVETVTFAIYADEKGGAPLWQETQYVTVGAGGQYAALLGATLPEGVPLDIFATGDARWLGRRFERVGEPEQARVSLASVPYALKAADADTLGGRPASDYLLSHDAPAKTTADAATADAATSTLTAPSGAQAVTAGTSSYIAKFTGPSDLGDSIMYDTGARIGIGLTTPADALHVRINNPGGSATGLAVQNMGNTATSYSGMLFYDQFGALGQFQGFNNVTHEYRINNIASGGSINFMIGGSSKFLVANSGAISIAGDVTVNGNIGAKYQDVAEWVETSAPLEAGTVVIVDPTEPNRVLAANTAYDTRVAGAVSAQPGLLLGVPSASKAMVAQSGRVRVKVDASYGAVKIGDLLVTSPTPGYAMVSKAVKVGGERMHRPGTLLGKALEALPNGKGDVLVLLTLQ